MQSLSAEPSRQISVNAPSMRKMDRLVLGFIVTLVLGMSCLLLARSTPMSANDMSRWATVERLVFKGTYVINGSHFSNTLDRIFSVDEKGNKHYYSSKPAFLATMVSGIAWVFDLVGLEIVHPGEQESRLTMSIILILINYLPFALILWCFYQYLRRSFESVPVILIAFLTVAVGTYFTGYLSTLNNHTPGMTSIFASLFALERYRSDPKKNTKLIIWAAFFSGLAVAFESPAMLFALSLMIYIVFQTKNTVLSLKAAAACCFPVLIWIICEYLATGMLLPRQVYTMLGQTHSFRMDEYWQQQRDVDAYLDPYPIRAFHMLLGHHGFFSLTPVFLLIPMALIVGKANIDRAFLKKIALTFLLTFVTFTVFCIKTVNYGGLCQGFRWMFWLIPFWLMLLPEALAILERHGRNWKIVALGLLGISCYSAFTSLLSPWSLSWLDKLLRPELLKFM